MASREERDIGVFSKSIVTNDIIGRKVLRGIIPICAHYKQIRDCEKNQGGNFFAMNHLVTSDEGFAVRIRLCNEPPADSQESADRSHS